MRTIHPPCRLKRFRRQLLSVIILATTPLSVSLTTGNLSAQSQRSDPGLETGVSAPEFRLTDQKGRSLSLNELRADGKKVAIVFHRSADW